MAEERTLGVLQPLCVFEWREFQQSVSNRMATFFIPSADFFANETERSAAS